MKNGALVSLALRYSQTRSFVLPNHSANWLVKTIKIAKKARETVGGVGSYLLVGGTFYGAMAKGLYPDANIWVVEKDPVASVGQLFLVWLYEKGIQYSELLALFFLKDINKRHLAHKHTYFIRKKQYLDSQKVFFKFLREQSAQPDIKLFERVFSIVTTRQGLILCPPQKGIYPEIFQELRSMNLELKTPDRIVIKDIMNARVPRFDCVITNNVFDLVPDPSKFLNKVSSVANRNGIIEISTYTNRILLMGTLPTQLKQVSIPKKTIGRYTYLTVKGDTAVESTAILVPGQNVFIFKKR